MQKELKLIYSLLKDKNYHTANEISKMLNISNKTSRKYVNELKELLTKHSLYIESIPSKGYLLKGDILSDNKIFNSKTYLIDTSEKRVDFLSYYLIYYDNYIKIEDLSNLLYVSTKTISLDIKILEKKLLKYNLNLSRKPYYGIKIVGEEIDIRNFLVDLFNTWLNENKFNKILEEYLNISSFDNTYKFFSTRNIKISDISFQNLILSIIITCRRVSDKKIINNINIEKDNLFIEKKCIIIDFLNTYFNNYNLDDNDIDYITIRFLIAETLNYSRISNQINEIKEIISEILKYMNLTFQIELYSNEEFYKNLYTHLFALTTRIRFNIPIENPLLDEIMKNMKFEYNIALYLAKILKKRYKKPIPKEEIGYLAVILRMGLETNKKNYIKKNILIVCPSGRGISKFLIHTYENLFSTYTNNVKSCGVNELLEMNLDNIDIIFSLVDIDAKINKPIYKINYFLEKEDLENIKEILSDEKSKLKQIIPEDLFIYVDEKLSKDEILKLMSERLIKIKNMPKNAYELLVEREKLGMTEISKDIAIPHFISVINDINLLGVVITKHKVKWQNNNVNLIFFICLDNEKNNNEFIYQFIIKLIDNNNNLKKVLKTTSYDQFIDLINNNLIN